MNVMLIESKRSNAGALIQEQNENSHIHSETIDCFFVICMLRVI